MTWRSTVRMPRRSLLALASSLLPFPAGAAYPERPVVLLHGFAPGGSADVLARTMAGPLGSALGQPVVVEARPGAGGMIAAGGLARAPADGHTIGLMTGGHAVGAAFGRNLGFDPVGAFAWISLVVEYAFVIAVRADHPARDLRALLALAAAPAGLAFGSAGAGSTHHLAGELLSAMTGAPLTHVPYRGEANAITALLGGDIPVAIATTATAAPHLRAGRLRALGMTAAQRSASYPEIPAVAETVPGYVVTTWAGLAAPAATPGPVLQALHQTLLGVAAQPALRSRLAELVDGDARTSTPEELRALVTGEIARWRRLIEERRIQPE